MVRKAIEVGKVKSSQRKGNHSVCWELRVGEGGRSEKNIGRKVLLKIIPWMVLNTKLSP